MLSAQDVIDALNAAPVSALWAAVLLLFLLVSIGLIRSTRLKRRVNDLSASVEQLVSENAARYTRQLLNRPILGDDDLPAEAKIRASSAGSRLDWQSHQKAP